MYLTQREGFRYIVADIEADDLDATKIWVLCWEDLDSDTSGEIYDYEEMKSFLDNPLHIFIGHNFLKFDAPTLNRLTGSKLPVSRILDTLIYSTLYHPSLPGGHSLEAWGQRMGFPKGDFSDFSSLSSEMVEYCKQDVRVTKRLFLGIRNLLVKIGFQEKTFEIQHKITTIIERQRKTGFYFDGPRAIALSNKLRAREAELENEIRRVFPPKLELIGEYARAFRKDGSPTEAYRKHSERFDNVELDGCGGYRTFDYVDFNIGSPKQRVEKLLSLGWEPDEHTKPSKTHPKGQPKVTEKSLIKFAEETDAPEIASITKWMAINGRANMINTWLDNWDEDTRCIHGKLFVADTLRFRHQAPNTANIPAVRVRETKDEKGNVVEKYVLYGENGYYTYEARDLWCSRPGRTLVGTDAAGLELRMLAHYLNRPDFTEGVVNGDPHQTNADIVGIERPQAKTLIYAVCYGAGPAKIAATLKVSVKEGGRIRSLFLERLGLKDLIDECQAEQECGRVWLVDGAGLICPSPHAALNYKLQGGGARVMAQGSIFLEGHIRRAGLDSFKVGDIHDEWQYDVDPKDAEEHGKLAVQAIQEAGEELNLNVPLTGNSKIGMTWAETH